MNFNKKELEARRDELTAIVNPLFHPDREVYGLAEGIRQDSRSVEEYVNGVKPNEAFDVINSVQAKTEEALSVLIDARDELANAIAKWSVEHQKFNEGVSPLRCEECYEHIVEKFNPNPTDELITFAYEAWELCELCGNRAKANRNATNAPTTSIQSPL